MSDAMIKKIYDDVEFLKKKIIDIDMKLERSRLEFDDVAEEEAVFFSKVLDKTKGTDFWTPRKK